MYRRNNGGPASSSKGDQSKKIFIGGVPRSVVDEEYAEYFRSFGEVTDCILMRDGEGVCRGFGFVTYKEQAAYDSVFQADLQLRGTKLDARKAVPMNEVSADKSGVKVFVGGLVADVDKHMLKEFFSQYGAIEDAIVMMDSSTGKSRGFGFVTFADSSSVEELLLHPKFEFHGKLIECKRAQPSATLNRMRRSRGGGRGRGSYGGQFGRGGGFRQPRFTEYANQPQIQGYGRGQNQFQGGQPGTWVERQGESWGSGVRGVPGRAVAYTNNMGYARGGNAGYGVSNAGYGGHARFGPY